MVLLVEYKKLTFTKAFKIATSIELATSGAKNIQQQASSLVPEEVNKVEMKELPKTKQTAYRCGEEHNKEHCPFKDKSCFYCGKGGHIAKVRKTKQRSHQTSYASKRVNQMTEDEQEEPGETYQLFTIRGNTLAYTSMLCIDGHNVEMEIDTGSAVTLMSNNMFRKLFANRKLEKTKAQLRAYAGEDVKVLGAISVPVKQHSKLFNLPLLVVDGQGPSLLGGDWLEQLQMSSLHVNQFTGVADAVHELEKKYPDLWKSDLGQVKGLKAKINAPESMTPKFLKPRPVPYAIRDKVNEELQRSEKEGVIEPVQFAEWAAPIVPIQTTNGQIRL